MTGVNASSLTGPQPMQNLKNSEDVNIQLICRRSRCI